MKLRVGADTNGDMLLGLNTDAKLGAVKGCAFKAGTVALSCPGSIGPAPCPASSSITSASSDITSVVATSVAMRDGLLSLIQIDAIPHQRL